MLFSIPRGLPVCGLLRRAAKAGGFARARSARWRRDKADLILRRSRPTGRSRLILFYIVVCWPLPLMCIYGRVCVCSGGLIPKDSGAVRLISGLGGFDLDGHVWNSRGRKWPPAAEGLRRLAQSTIQRSSH